MLQNLGGYQVKFLFKLLIFFCSNVPICFLSVESRKNIFYLSVSIDSTMAYSKIALKILNMQVTTNFSIAFNVLDEADGALDLEKKMIRYTSKK